MRYASVPLNQNQNGWLQEGALATAFPSLVGDTRADWVVVGSGFAGVAFARQLAQHNANLKIILMDAACAAESSSARNSGFILGLPHNIGSSTAELKKAHAYRALLQEGINQLTRVISQQRIECEWDNAGKYHCQVAANHQRVLKEYTDSLAAMDEPYQMMDKDALYQKLGTRFYHQGIYTPSSILVDPARLIHGLAHSLPNNVTVYNNTPVLAIHHGDLAQVVTPYGTINTTNIMLATNALSRELSPVTGRQAVRPPWRHSPV